ncbi:natural cytotoxicity triggering receptor 2-like isoform X6 [Mustela erminea]|uniref:natural cytotoxicity triggering receptor 2-like isoform X6 n=1 Tax=Mustela erminea TaxID=36723 RepID=UPI00138755DF|nr:natural cytotoxicity triggering receptor 2-like isoform X6 [Mustela erminea]
METQEPCTKQGYCLHVQIHNCPWRSRLPSACNQPFPALPLPSLALAFLILSISEALEELSRVRPAPGFLFPGAPMSSPASPQGKGGRLWKALLLPLLLPLLIAGSWALPEAQHLHRVAGQTLSVTCQYPPKVWPYERKGWCKELSAFKCTRLVTSSGPGRLVQSSRFSIWDNPSTGLFIVTMTGLKEEDSGHYWCRIYHASGNSVSKSIRFYLAVSPAPASTQASRASAELVSSPTQSSVPPAGRAKQAPRPASAITTLSPPQRSGPRALCAACGQGSGANSPDCPSLKESTRATQREVSDASSSAQTPGFGIQGWPVFPRPPGSSSLDSEPFVHCKEKAEVPQNLFQDPWLHPSLQC